MNKSEPQVTCSPFCNFLFINKFLLTFALSDKERLSGTKIIQLFNSTKITDEKAYANTLHLGAPLADSFSLTGPNRLLPSVWRRENSLIISRGWFKNKQRIDRQADRALLSSHCARHPCLQRGFTTNRLVERRPISYGSNDHCHSPLPGTDRRSRMRRSYHNGLSHRSTLSGTSGSNRGSWRGDKNTSALPHPTSVGRKAGMESDRVLLASRFEDAAR